MEIITTRVLAGAMALAAITGVVHPTMAQQAQDIKLCNAKDGTPDDQIIRGCTNLIKSGKLTNKNLVIALVSRGMAYGSKGQYDRAIQDYDQAIKRDPTHAEAFTGRGFAYAQQEQCDPAIQDFTQAIKMDPEERAVGYAARAYCYIATGQRDLAIADYSELVRLDPKDASNYAARGAAYVAKGDADRAIADFNEMIRLHPGKPAGYVSRASAYAAKGDNDRAIANYNEAIGLDPKDPEVYASRADLYLAKGDNNRAIADYDRAIQLDAKSDSAYLRRGIAYFYAGSLARAQADFKRGTDLDPKDPFYALWLDIAERRNGLPSRLAQFAKTIDKKEWPGPIVRLFLGELTPSATLTAAEDKDATKKNGQLCEGSFYSAEYVLLEERKDEALAFYKAAAAVCPPDYIEGIAARAGIRSLGAMP